MPPSLPAVTKQPRRRRVLSLAVPPPSTKTQRPDKDAILPRPGGPPRRRTHPDPSAGSNTECSVCLRIFLDPVTTPCAHTFCRGCVADMLRQHSAAGAPGALPCPLCRSDLPSALEAYPTDHYAQVSVEIHHAPRTIRRRRQEGQRHPQARSVDSAGLVVARPDSASQEAFGQGARCSMYAGAGFMRRRVPSLVLASEGPSSPAHSDKDESARWHMAVDAANRALGGARAQVLLGGGAVALHHRVR